MRSRVGIGENQDFRGSIGLGNSLDKIVDFFPSLVRMTSGNESNSMSRESCGKRLENLACWVMRVSSYNQQFEKWIDLLQECGDISFQIVVQSFAREND